MSSHEAHQRFDRAGFAQKTAMIQLAGEQQSAPRQLQSKRFGVKNRGHVVVEVMDDEHSLIPGVKRAPTLRSSLPSRCTKAGCATLTAVIIGLDIPVRSESMSINSVMPLDVHPPAGAYSHGAMALGPGRTLYISGQVGVDPGSVLVEGFAGQAAQCWSNIVATLRAADMTVHDLVKVTTFLTDVRNAAELGRIREPFLDGARPASTLIGTSALVRSEWLIEIEAIAFKND